MPHFETEDDVAARVTVRWLDGGDARQGGLDKLAEARSTGRVWVDILDPDEKSLDSLAAEFGLHPLAVEDVLHYPQRPKLDSYPGHVFIIWLVPARDGDGLEGHELDLFLGKDFIISLHDRPLPFVEALASQTAEALGRGTAWVAHGLIDRAVDAVFPIVDDIADHLEDLEDQMLTDARTPELQRLYAEKRLLVALHRMIGPERDLLRELARQEELVDPESYRYFQDVGDHLARAADAVDTYREVASGAMDIYLSSTSNRLNVIMKQLTIVATIFMPLTLISGIYGMNFQYMPELGWRLGYPITLGLMASIAAVMLVFIRRRKWW